MQFLTFHTLDSEATMLLKIREKYREHWYAGLRQAELEIQQIQDFLKAYSWWQRLWYFLFPKSDRLRGQARHLLQTAIGEWEEIYEHHKPEIELCFEGKNQSQKEQAQTKKNLQSRYAAQVQLGIEWKSVASSMLARIYGLDKGEAQLLLSRDPDMREKILYRATEEVLGLESTLLIQKMVEYLDKISPEQRLHVLDGILQSLGSQTEAIAQIQGDRNGS